MLPVLLIADNLDQIQSHIDSLLKKEYVIDIFYYGDKEAISIDTVREINRITQQPAFRKRAFILFDFHLLKKEAQNALLKTLEERNEENIFIMVSSDEYKVLPTILSRCRIEHLSENIENDFSLLESMSLFTQASSQNILLATQSLSKGDHTDAIRQLRDYLHVIARSSRGDEEKRASMYRALGLVSEVENQLKNNIYPEFTLDYLLLCLKQSKLIPLSKVDEL